MQTRTSDNWQVKPGGWDALNLDLLQSDEDFPEVSCMDLCIYNVHTIVNINDYKKFEPGCIISTFIDDYHLERFWNQPEHYGRRWLQVEAGAVMTPDYSLLIGMPLPMMMWNTYRSRMLGNLWQAMGVKVIPTVTWADERSFDFCFKGICKGSIVAVSDVGIRSQVEREYFNAGFDRMKEEIQPSKILFMSGSNSKPLYSEKNIIFLDSFSKKRRKKWEEEANLKKRDQGITDLQPEQKPYRLNHKALRKVSSHKLSKADK